RSPGRTTPRKKNISSVTPKTHLGLPQMEPAAQFFQLLRHRLLRPASIGSRRAWRGWCLLGVEAVVRAALGETVIVQCVHVLRVHQPGPALVELVAHMGPSEADPGLLGGKPGQRQLEAAARLERHRDGAPENRGGVT